MPRTHSITLPNLGALISTWLVIHHTNNEFEWEITGIEMYRDADATQLLQDDISIADLDRDTQERIYAALTEEDQHRRRHARRDDRISIDRLRRVMQTI